jgi:hypothetical protein
LSPNAIAWTDLGARGPGGSRTGSVVAVAIEPPFLSVLETYPSLLVVEDHCYLGIGAPLRLPPSSEDRIDRLSVFLSQPSKPTALTYGRPRQRFSLLASVANTDRGRRAAPTQSPTSCGKAAWALGGSRLKARCGLPNVCSTRRCPIL